MGCEKWVAKKYGEFYQKNGHLPHLFHPYNGIELNGVCSTISTSTGVFTGVGTVLVVSKKRRNHSEK